MQLSIALFGVSLAGLLELWTWFLFFWILLWIVEFALRPLWRTIKGIIQSQ